LYTVLSTGPLGHPLPLEDQMRLAIDYGFDGVKINLAEAMEIGPKKVAQMLRAAELRNGGALIPFPLLDAQETYDEGMKNLPGLLDIAGEIGCDRLSTWLLSFSDERDFEENLAFHVERLGPFAARLRERGLSLAMEFLGPKTIRDGHKYEFIHTGPAMVEMCRGLGDNVGLLLDCWHWYTSGGTVEEIERLGPADVVDVHVNDAPPGIPPDEQIDNVRCLPGTTGVIDLRGFLGALHAIGYDGPVMVEPFLDSLRELEAEEAVSRAAEALQNAWAEAGLD